MRNPTKMRLHAPLAVLLLTGCFSGYDTPPDRSLTVHRGAFSNDLLLTGELEAARGALISVPELPSWQSAIKWLATDGAEVKAGERVAELDNTEFTTDLDAKRQSSTQAHQELQQKEAEWSADLRDKEVDADKKQAEYEKTKLEASVPAELLSGREYQDRQMKYHRAEVELKKAKDVLASQRRSVASDRSNLLLKIERADRDVTTAEKAIDSLVLRAPRDGIVVVKDHPWEQRKLQNGDTVWVGFPLALIPELDSLQIAAALADVDDGRIRPGMKATVTLDGYPDVHVSGVVSSISAVAQESNRNGSLRRVFRVVVKLAQVDPARMRPGLSARVEVHRASAQNALLIPRSALDLDGSSPHARLESGKLVPVQLGDCNAQECVVLGGISEGVRLHS